MNQCAWQMGESVSSAQKDADGALGENEAAENDAMRFGSLGALVPDAVYDRYWSWGSDEGSEGFDASDCESEECIASEEPLPTADEAFELFLGWVADHDHQPWHHQEEALDEPHGGQIMCILGTPTGSGKSLVALGLHFMALCTGKVSYYTAPIKALVSGEAFLSCRCAGQGKRRHDYGRCVHQSVRSGRMLHGRDSREPGVARGGTRRYRLRGYGRVSLLRRPSARLGVAGSFADASAYAVLADERDAWRRLRYCRIPQGPYRCGCDIIA